MTDLTPIRREIIVPADPATAFDVFTGRIGAWWPLADLSVHGEGAHVAFVDDTIVETADGQPDALWGRVTTWDPPSRLAFTWHPGQPVERASHVTVTFSPVDDGTLVRLEHAGWDVFEDPAAARAEYDHGWPFVLDRFQGAVKERDEAEATWVALVHRPGPAAAGVTRIFDDPRFGEHVAFLRRMRAAGYLVAAGPLADEPGTGMTVLRLPGAGRLEEATRLATTDDASVADGFFTVTVRPWRVVMHA